MTCFMKYDVLGLCFISIFKSYFWTTSLQYCTYCWPCLSARCALVALSVHLSIRCPSIHCLSHAHIKEWTRHRAAGSGHTHYPIWENQLVVSICNRPVSGKHSCRQAFIAASIFWWKCYDNFPASWACELHMFAVLQIYQYFDRTF